MKVLFVVRSLTSGGAQRQLVVLAGGLRRRGHQVTVATFYPGGPFESALRQAGVTVRTLEKCGRWDVVGFASSLVKLVRAEAPDILHTYLLDPSLLVTVLRPFIPAPKFVWGIRWAEVDFRQFGWLSGASFQLGCWLSAVPDAIIVNSRAGVAFHRRHGFPEARMHYIPNGIDTQQFAPDRAAGQGLRARWGIPTDAPLVGLVGRLDLLKDHESFITAAAALARTRPDVRFVCLGSGPASYRDRVMRHADAVDVGAGARVQFVDGLDDMRAAYNAFDLLVSSSISEGFSNVIGEAMACGVRCLVTDVGDSAQIVGDPAAVVPPRNPEALQRAMTRLLSDPADRAAAVRQRIVEHFSVAQLVDRTEQLLMRLLSNVSAPALAEAQTPPVVHR